MGNRDTIGGDDVSGEAATAFLESDFGVGMNVHHTLSSYDCNKMTNFMSSSPSYYQSSTEIASGVSLKPSSGSDSGGVTEASGKMYFTVSQWEELERQTVIYKYIMASIPVPPQLLLPLSTRSNKGGMELRFSNGSDQEPWRCKRTDGKKWRCSRDVAPDQKYCERHCHKSRPRSRKHVEIQSHNTNNITTNVNSSYQNPRCTGTGSIPVSLSNQQFQQSMNSHSPRVGSKRNHLFPQDFEGNHQHESHFNYSDESAGERRQNFIDAWSRSGGGGDNCSLTLSMQCSTTGGIDDDGADNQSFEIGNGDVLKLHNHQWLNQGSWMGSSPGGPLGEALGLGIASTTTSSSCDNGGINDHELSFLN